MTTFQRLRRLGIRGPAVLLPLSTPSPVPVNAASNALLRLSPGLRVPAGGVFRVTEILGFSEDEPRDSRGRWSSAEYNEESKSHRLTTGEKLPTHLQKLRIPPAWTDVKVNLDKKADLWVKGKDAKGRQQSIYSPKHTESASLQKFSRVQKLEQKLNKIEEKNERNIGKQDLKDHAEVLKLILHTGIRPGSEKDTGAEKQAYGATTLLGKHVVTDEKGNVSLQFTGKKGVELNIPVTDRGVAAMVGARAKASGEEGKLFPGTSASKLLGYTHSIGGQIKTKDFRTLLANRVAKAEVEARPAPTSASGYKKAVMEVARAVATKLGNTASIALKSYINPHTFSVWQGAIV